MRYVKAFESAAIVLLVMTSSLQAQAASDRLACPATREVEANVQTRRPGQATEVSTRGQVSLPLVGMMLSIKEEATDEPQYQIPRTWQLAPGVFQEWRLYAPYPETLYLHCAYGHDRVFSIQLVSHETFDRCRVMLVKGKSVNGRRSVDTAEAYCERMEARAGEPRAGSKGP